VDDGALLEVLREAADAVREAMGTVRDWGPSGRRAGQYAFDLVADDAAVRVLQGAGLSVLSEESGKTLGTSADLLVVVDPIDGSTNASRSIPWYSTSLCVLDDEGPLVAVVQNQVTGERYEAVRRGGAERAGRAVTASGCRDLGSAMVALTGFPPRVPRWAQFRALGASSLEICAVAAGSLDAFVTTGGAKLYGWDYLGGLLVCLEAGAVATALTTADLIARDDRPRSLAVAATSELLEGLLAAMA
jgi:fructose-1,6-bisphosphatase/inositol monophosphatase family enzyme